MAGLTSMAVISAEAAPSRLTAQSARMTPSRSSTPPRAPAIMRPIRLRSRKSPASVLCSKPSATPSRTTGPPSQANAPPDRARLLEVAPRCVDQHLPDLLLGHPPLTQHRQHVLADVPEVPVRRHLLLGGLALDTGEVVDVAAGVVREHHPLGVPA